MLKLGVQQALQNAVRIGSWLATGPSKALAETGGTRCLLDRYQKTVMSQTPSTSIRTVALVGQGGGRAD